MHTVEVLEQAIESARRLGFKIRMEWLGGNSGGSCEIRGEPWIFIDLALSADEQLAVVLDALEQEADQTVLPLPIQPTLQRLIQQRKSA
jgi:hypothetical protein